MPGSYSLTRRFRTQRQAKLSSDLQIDRRGEGTGIQDEVVGSMAVKHTPQYDLIVEKIERYLQVGVGGERGQDHPAGNETATDAQPHTLDCEARLFPCPAWLGAP